MDLISYHDFLLAAVGASASFIGLLFVALSLVLTRKENDVDLEFTDRRLAESAFTALAIVFFIALAGLIPGTNIGYVTFITAFVGLRNSWLLFGHLKDIQTKEGVSSARKIESFWIAGSFVTYVIQAVYGLLIILHPTDMTNVDVLVGLLLALFGGGLVRSWELTGVRR